MTDQIARPENAGPENAGLENDGLNDGLEFDGPEQHVIMSLVCHAYKHTKDRSLFLMQAYLF